MIISRQQAESSRTALGGEVRACVRTKLNQTGRLACDV